MTVRHHKSHHNKRSRITTSTSSTLRSRHIHGPTVFKNLKTVAPSIGLPVSPPPSQIPDAQFSEIGRLRAEFMGVRRQRKDIRTLLLSACLAAYERALESDAVAAALKVELDRLGYRMNWRSGLEHRVILLGFPGESPPTRTSYAKALHGAKLKKLTAEQFRDIVHRGHDGRGGIKSLIKEHDDFVRSSREPRPVEQSAASIDPESMHNGASPPGADTSAMIQELDGGSAAASVVPDPRRVIALDEEALARIATFQPQPGDRFVVVVEWAVAGELKFIECLNRDHRGNDIH